MGDLKLNTCLHTNKRLYNLSVYHVLKEMQMLCLVLTVTLISSIELVAVTLLDNFNPNKNPIILKISDQNEYAHFVLYKYSTNGLVVNSDISSFSITGEEYSISIDNDILQTLVFDIENETSNCFEVELYESKLNLELIESDKVLFQDQLKSINDFPLIIEIERINPQLESPINSLISFKPSNVVYPDKIGDGLRFRVLHVFLHKKIEESIV